MAEKFTVSFPNLGIDDFVVNPVAFPNFSLEIRWYAIIICTGIISAFIYFLQRGKRTEKLLEDDLLNATLIAVPLGVVGARFLYVITKLDTYESFVDMINIRQGGLAIYGGIIFGALALLGYALFKRHNPLKYFDAISPGVMLAQAIGRWGNFMNGEAYGIGYNAEEMPWCMRLVKDGVVEYTHPTFLYESLWNVIGFVIANLLYKNKKFDGQIFTFYVAWYGFGRAWIEFLREDSLPLGSQRLMVWLGFLSCAAAIGAHVYLYYRGKKEITDFEKTKTPMEETVNDNP